MSVTTDSMSVSEAPIVDGFTHSLSVRLLPTTYRALVQAQMETLRRASNYQFKIHSAPNTESNPGEVGFPLVPAFSQVEYQIKIRPGTLIWGMWLAGDEIFANSNLFIQVTDMSTGSPLFSDYELIGLISSILNGNDRQFNRYPYLLSEPRIVSGSGQVNVELYNSTENDIFPQFVMFCAEPLPLPDLCADPAVPCSQD